VNNSGQLCQDPSKPPSTTTVLSEKTRSILTTSEGPPQVMIP